MHKRETNYAALLVFWECRQTFCSILAALGTDPFFKSLLFNINVLYAILLLVNPISSYTQYSWIYDSLVSMINAFSSVSLSTFEGTY